MTKTHNKTTLRRKIFLRITILVGLALIATGTFSLLIAKSAIRERTMNDLVLLTTGQGNAIESIVDSHRSYTRLLGTEKNLSLFLQKRVQSVREAAEMRTYLQKKQDFVEGLDGITLLNTEGIAVIATDSQLEKQDFSGLEYLSRGSNGTYIGPLNVVQGKRTYAIATPIRSTTGELMGVLIAEYGLDVVYETLSGAKSLGKTGEYLLLEPEKNGSLCFNPSRRVFSSKGTLAGSISNTTDSTDPRFAHSQGTHSLLCSRAASGHENVFSDVDEDGQRVIAGYHYLSDIGLGLIVKVEESEIFQPIRLLIATLIGTTCILLLLVIFIALRLSQEVVQPILRLRESLQHLNKENWKHKRSIFSGDELEVLDKEAARLAVRLEEAYTSLEKKVEERTQELAERNSKDKALLESIGEGFLAIDMNGKVITSNHAAERMLKWEKKEILNAHFSSVIHLRDKRGNPIPQNQHHIQKAMDRKATVHTTPGDTYNCERKDGTRFPIGITATPFRIGTDMKGIVVTFRDITEEKRIDLMKSEFISLASHQLRTPLTAIGWYMEMLEAEVDGLSDDQKDYVEQILSSHDRMVDLVNSLLNVSRIELGKLKIDPERIKLKDLVEKTSKELLPQIQQKKIHYKETIPDDLELFVDVPLVEMVIENLLSNAVKYTPEDQSITLTVMTDGEELRFEVCDTGMGIPDHQQKRVFEKLFRADNVVQSDTDGTGIGLYIAKYTSEAWGGRLWFESQEGKGTTFYFTVPMKMKKVEGTNTLN
jgi:PAS domain S-box-containing protein